MEISVNKMRCSVQRLLALLPLHGVTEPDNRVLQDFLQLKVYNDKNVESFLTFLTAKLIDSAFTEHIAVAFEEYLLLLITSSMRCDEEIDGAYFHEYQSKCIALAKLMRSSVDARRYASTYFRNKPPPYQNADNEDATPKTKKSKKNTTPPIDDLAIVKCCYQLLCSDAVFFKELWNWSTFVEQHFHTENTHDLKQLYCNHIIAILTNMSATQLGTLNDSIPPQVLLQFDCEQSGSPRAVGEAPSASALAADKVITLSFCSDLVTNVEGVLLPIFNKDNYKFYAETDGSYDKIVKVDSTKVNLRSIGLGIATGKAVCLSGPVGCGKTTLVEYLARKTGRICPKLNEIEQHNLKDKANNAGTLNHTPNSKDKVSIGSKRRGDLNSLESLEKVLDMNANTEANKHGFLRIQLGDQTDSKMLLGQYRCTDVPGEFIWLPGVLTQAVLNGYWLLLEDLDSATQDTYTILSGLLENDFLSVPGFRDCVKIAPGFQLFVTVRTNKSSTNSAQKSLFSLLEKYLYTVNILPLSRNELCQVVSSTYPKLATVANRIVDVFLTFSSGNHAAADNLRQQETGDKADTTKQYVALPFEQVSLSSVPNSGRLVSTRDLVKLCQRSNPMFNVTSTECAYFVFQNAVDLFCSYLPQGKEKTKLITSIGAKLGIIQSRCETFAEQYKPEVQIDCDRIKVGRAELFAKWHIDEEHENDEEDHADAQSVKRQKLSRNTEMSLLKAAPRKSSSTFSFTRMASCILERITVCVAHSEPVLLVGETGVGKTSSVQYLAERTRHKLVVVNMNNQSDVSDLVGGFKPVDLTYVIFPIRSEFELLFRKTFNQAKNEVFLNKFAICYNQGKFSIVIKLMIKIVNSVFEKQEQDELRPKELELLPRWHALKVKLLKLNSQLAKSINISFAFIPGSLVNCIKNGDWVLLDEINLATAETLECLSTILEPDGSVVLLEKGDFTPVKRHPDFRIFACMNPSTDIGKKDLPVGIRNRFTEFFADELTTDADLTLLISDYLHSTGIQRKSVTHIVKLYKRLKELSHLELNDGLGNRPVYSLRTLCRSLRICAKNLCGSIERNLYESFCLSFLTQLDPTSHSMVLQLIKDAMLSNAKAILKQGIPKPGENYLNFEGYWIEQGPKPLQECSNYILTSSVKENLKDLSRIISIGKLPILLQGPTSAGKTSLIEYVAKCSGNHCLRINNHEHTDLQEYIGTYVADSSGFTFKEGVLVQAMRNGFWIILDELNLASTDILEALNRVLDDNRELFIPETQTVVKAHANFMLFATQNPPGLYGGRKTLSRAFKNRFIELHFSDIPRNELEIILEKRCQIPASYAKKMVMCMSDLQKNRKTTSKNVFTLRDLFRWGNRYTFADKKLLEDQKYDWNQHLIEEGYLVLSAKVRTDIEIEIIEEALFRNFRKNINLATLFDAQSDQESSPVTKDIIVAVKAYTQRTDIVWTRNLTRMAVLTAKALQFNEPVLLVGPTGCGKTTICQILASMHAVKLRILNCHMHTEGADFLGGLRPYRESGISEQPSGESEKLAKKLFEWADGPLIQAMLEGSYFMADEISLAEDSVLERLNCILEPERTVLLAEKGGVSGEESEMAKEFVVQARDGFQFLATMNPGGDFGKKELSPALRNRFTEVWCHASDTKDDLIQIASTCMHENLQPNACHKKILQLATYLVDIVFHIRDVVDRFKYSVRDILAWATYMVTNAHLSFQERAIFGLETIFLDAFEMLPHVTAEKVELLKANIIEFSVKQADVLLGEKFTLAELQEKRGVKVVRQGEYFGIQPFFIAVNPAARLADEQSFLFDVPTTKQNLFRLLSALSLRKPVLLEGPPGVGKTSIVENIAQAIGYDIVRINLCEHTDLADLFGTDLPAEDHAFGCPDTEADQSASNVGSFVWRDGPLLAALKADNTWILLDELNLAPQSVLEGLNAILDHRGEVYIPELNKTFVLSQQTRIFACQNPLKQGDGRKGLPQSFLNRFNKVYLRKLTTADLLHVVNGRYQAAFQEIRDKFAALLQKCVVPEQNLFHLYAAIAKADKHQQQLEQPDLTFDLSDRLVSFSELLDKGIADMEFGYKGGPYEINLRDILRWCELLVNTETKFYFPSAASTPPDTTAAFQQLFQRFLLTLYERMKLVYYQRMRSEQDKLFIRNAFAKVFSCDAEQLHAWSEDVSLYWTAEAIYLNDIVLPRAAATQALRAYKSKEQAPVLLSSQREMLKHIVECVHIEKPVLLCGATDTGKTKLIDVLCTLSNQVCHTDNIDDSVTGSFQQIDLNRHLEEISQRVEGVFLAYVQNLCLEEAPFVELVAELLSAWSQYTVLANTRPELNHDTGMSAELATYRQRILLLHNVIEKLQSAPLLKNTPTSFRAVLAQQQQRLLVLKNHTRHAESLNTGGAFEWVDSVIVKSLKSGEYIALEHVNLCSAAVLDRLNPVFEPNGSLLISEKGVSANDTAEVVHKSPNFRAFLTIDPKNGELSRAMRNRCVELALTKDAYSVDDMRMIVHSHGVRDIAAINCLIEIHRRMAHLTEISYVNISQLTQCAFLTASYNRIGYALERAIYVSGMEVYVYSCNVDLMGYGLEFYQNKLRQIVLDETKKFASSASAVAHDHLANMMLNCNELNETTLIKLQVEPLKVLLQHSHVPQEALAAVLTEFEALNFTGVDSAQLQKFYIYVLYDTSTMADVQLRSLYLEKLLAKQPLLQRLSSQLYKCVEEFQQHFTIASKQLPWNQRLYPRIRYCAESEQTFRLSSLLIVQLLLKDIPHETMTKLHKLDALTYSQSVASQLITDKLNNEFLKHLANFLAQLREVLPAAIRQGAFDLQSFAQFITSCQWFNRLLETSATKLFLNGDFNRDVVDKLLLHFKWLDKNLLKQLEALLPDYRQLNAEFESSLQKLTTYVHAVKHPLNLLRKVYAKQMTQFQPFYQQEQLKCNALTQHLDELLSVVPWYGCFTPDYILKKFVAQKAAAAVKSRAIATKHESRFDYRFKVVPLNDVDFPQVPQQLKVALRNFMLDLTEQDNLSTTAAGDWEMLASEVETIEHFVNAQPELADNLKPKEIELGMLPLREYYLTKALTHALTAKSSTEVDDISVAYCEEIPSLSIATWQLISLTRTSKYKHFLELWSTILDYMDGISSNAEFAQLFGYLQDSFKNLSSFSRLILNAAFNQQLKNIATRSNCSKVLRNSEEIESHYVYEGPSLSNALIWLMFQPNGHLKPVPLNDLDLWKISLEQMRQLMWQNSLVMTPTYSILGHNLKTAQLNAKKLLHEVEHVQQLCQNLENENFSDYNESFQKLVLSLSEEHSKAASLEQSTFKHASLRYQQVQYHASLLSALSGGIELCLLTFTPLIDPVEKNRLKSVYLVEDINCLTTMTTVYDFMKIVMQYKHFGSEIYAALEERLRSLAEKQQKFSQKLALRPEKCLYSSLVQDITHFLKTNCEPQTLHNLLKAVQHDWTTLTAGFQTQSAAQALDGSAETLNKISLWLANSQRFVHHILKPYTDYYQDFLQPLQCAVDQMRFGLEGLKVALAQVRAAIVRQSSTQLYVNINDGAKLANVMANIIEFPALRSMSVFNADSTHELSKNRSPIFSILERVPGSEFIYFTLMKAKLTELRNLITISSSISEQTFRDFDFVLNVSNQIWQEEEERRRKKQAEDESLYVTKTKCATEDEELAELQEIEENFPTNVQEDFGDFLLEDSLEKVMKLDKRQDLKSTHAQVVRDADYAFLGAQFIDIMEQYTHVYYHNAAAKRDKSAQLEFIGPFKERMQVFVKLFSQYSCSLNEWLDEEVYYSFGFAVGLQQQLLNELPLASKQARPYNFYKDPNIPEIISCTGVLTRIEQRVDEQLDLYPEHASLLDIKQVIGRIRCLPSTSPVVRFNTGFQILRQKVSQWNEVAHKNNNLREEEGEVAEYVQKWTKLELQFWRNCLAQTYEKVEAKAYKYWFFIYNLLQEYLLDHEIDSSYTDMKYTEKRFAAGEVLDAVDTAKKSKLAAGDVVKILRQFIESACYGDFQVRIQLLRAFELYLHNMNKQAVSPRADDRKCVLVAGLRNLQVYFAQFAQEIQQTKKSIRTPIENKLRELVKIESYNKDLSYFSMRNNVARVHRNLNKFLKQYRQELEQKITPVFQPTDATAKDYNFASDKEKEQHSIDGAKQYQLDVDMFVAPENLLAKLPNNTEAAASGAQTLVHKVGKLFSTARNVVLETVTNVDYPQLIIALDELFSEQVERCEHLRSLSVDRSKERPKQVLEAKQILQQKRKGLTDLFKTLAQLGINYKTGLMELSLRTEFEDYALPPFCLKTMFPGFRHKRLQTKMLRLNENLDQYYAKCVFKLKLLQNIMLSPLSELGPPNIERIKGFAVDFFLLVQNQRTLLSNTARQVYELGAIIKDFNEIAHVGSAATSEPVAHMAFSKTRHSYLALKCSIGRVRYVFEQLHLLLACAPDQQQEENQVLSSCERLLVQGSPHFSTLQKICASVLQLAKSTLADMLENDSEFLGLDKLGSYRAANSQLVKWIGQAKELLPVAKVLPDLLVFIEQTTTLDLKESTASETLQNDFDNADTELENVLHGVLLSLQKLYKKYPSIPEAEKPENTAESDIDAEPQLQEHHIKKKLYGSLVADWETLNIVQIVTKLSNLLITVKHSNPTPEKVSYVRKITSVLPMLEQYRLIAEYYLFQELGSHKVSVKMLSVMLTVFVEISTKGFCVPPDLMQDAEGEAKKEQKEGEGFGLEDGTGEKDASDKIESEDQLDDAKRPEDRKDEGDKQQEDCKEEKGIEMSDDFDGKMQDIEKPENEEDDSGESEDEEELNKEMGETEEGADKLDEQIWGDDEEKEEEEKELDDEDDGKGTKDDKDSHNDLDSKNEAAKEDGKSEHDKEGLDATDEPAADDKRKQQEQDIDNMKEPELDEEQVNNCHNELEEPPEAEEMDLGDMNNVDEEHEDGDEHGDENPFDIDAMKENMEAPEESKDEQKDDEKEGAGEDEAADSDDSDTDDNDAGKLKDDKNANEEENPEEDGDQDKKEDSEPEKQTSGELDVDTANEEQKEEEVEEKPDEELMEHEQSKDKSTKEDNVQSLPETENKGSADQVQNSNNEEDVKQDQKLDEQETGEEKDGVGQAENEENDGGHQGVAETQDAVPQDESKNERKTEEKRKQGRTNEERTLGEAEKNKLKQLKTIDRLKEQNDHGDDNEDSNEKDVEAEEYQHVKEPTNKDKTTLDNATEEQSKKMQHQEEEEMKDEEGETNDELMEVEEEAPNIEDTAEDAKEMPAEKFDEKSDKASKSDKTKDRSELPEEMEIEGEVVPTMTVPRSDDTFAHCNKEALLANTTPGQELSATETLELKRSYQQQLVATKTTLPQHEDFETWQSVSNRMQQNARDLCEQLRLILEPTKCTRLKGDYRTGRRINMKKIIPYIASQFRKDKIWLRRTKPAQRDYKITIAIDDSKSMHHNNSKTLTLEAISLVSQALTLLESGSLSIASFGEAPQIILNHTEQFDGPKLVNSLNFAQDKTKIASLLDFVRIMSSEEGGSGSDNGLFENLLLVLSDGRNIFSEGKARVTNAIKLARLQRIFLVYIIIDNPENKNSILDIQTMEILPDKQVAIKSYLDDFPFPYYVIVRDLNQLPLVLSEAMRQWFELVNSEQ